MLNLMVKAKQKELDFAIWETKGNKVQRPLENMLRQASYHRWIAQRVLQGETNLKGKLVSVGNAGQKELKNVAKALSAVGEDLQFTADGLGKRKREEFTGEKLAEKWENLKAEVDSMSLEDSEKAHLDVINHIKTMIIHAGDTSNLILDPDLDSYYLMDVTLLALPQTQDRLQNIAAFVERMYFKGLMTQEESVQASVFAAFLKEADLDRINASSQTSLNEDQNFYGVSDSLQKNLANGMTTNTAAVEPVVAKLKELSLIKNVKSFDIQSFRAANAAAIESVYKFHAMAFDELDKLLESRMETFHAGIRNAIGWAAAALLISAIIAFLMISNIVSRVKFFMTITKRISDGDLNARVEMTSGDEIGELARSFDGMTGHIQGLNADIEAKNEALKVINQNLEGIVAERTATIKTILDNVKFGFLLVDKSLNVQEGFSQSCKDLLGSHLKPGTPFIQAVGLGQTRNAILAKEFLQQAFDDFLPEEMTLHQLPSRVQMGEKILSLIATVVRDAKKEVSSILFTIVDATNLEKVEKENERHKVLVRLLKEVEPFKDFLDDSRDRLEHSRQAIASKDEGKLRAELHTVKGNSSAFDLTEIAKLIHEIEDLTQIPISEIDRIEAAFVGFLDHNFDILGLSWKEDTHELFAVSRTDLDSVVERVQRSLGADHQAMEELSKWAHSVQYKPARALVGALPEYGERLASRLGKSCRIRVEGGDVRMDPEIMRPIIQSLVHLVRNSIDHGIEFPHERNNKPDEGLIEIGCEDSQSHWRVVIRDDGKGINVNAVVEKALHNGLISERDVKKMSEKEKYRLIFLSGLSTADQVSDISGRGVGMSAIEAAVKDADGILDVDSHRGKGTVVTISVPKERRVFKASKVA
jgi:nitrogen fixation/metabolism regulation signal transduction histidine kinase